MKAVTLREYVEVKDFAIQAAKYFAEHPKTISFTTGNISPGALFALRFGLGNDCVVVFKIAEDFEVINFEEILRTFATPDQIEKSVQIYRDN